MRGNPFQELFIFIILWGVLLIPISLLSKDNAPVDIIPENNSIIYYECLATVNVTPKPSFFRLSQNDKVIWEENNINVHTLEKDISVKLEEKFADILLETEFKNGEYGAFELKLSPISDTDKSFTLWGENKVHHIMEFSWENSNG